MKHALLIIVIATLAAGCQPSTTGNAPAKDSSAYHRVWKMDKSWSALVEDPVQWTADNLADKPNADISHVKTKGLDIDHDRCEELLVWDQAMMGQAGGPVLVFRKHGEAHKYIGEIGTLNAKVLPLGPDGKLRVAVYSRIRGRKGEILVFTNDGDRFVLLSKEPIDGDTEEGKRRYEEIFGGNS